MSERYSVIQSHQFPVIPTLQSLNQKLVVGNIVKCFAEVKYITGSIALKTIVDSVQKLE